MRIAVLGAGAIGAYIGAMLARSGADVHLIARGAHCEAMARDGVRIVSESGEFTVRAPVTDDPTEVGPVDAVFLGLKAHQYAAAGPLLEPLLGPDTAVIAAQNGIPWWYFYGHGGQLDGRRVETVDPDGAVSRVIAPWRAIGCVVYCSTEIEAPGVIRHLEGTRFPLGEPDGSVSERCRELSAIMRVAGLKAPVAARIRDQVWLKLMGNVAFNPLSALTRATMAEICAHQPTRDAAVRIMTEALDVAQALGCDPKLSVEQRIAGAEQVGHHKTSTLQDLEAGKPLELAALVGAVVEFADLVGVDAPSLRTVHSAASLLDRTLQREPVRGATIQG